MKENSFYDYFQKKLAECFIPVKTLRETEDRRITLLRHQESGGFFVAREFAGDPAVYRRLMTVSCPHLPENTKPAKELSDVKIDQVVIGSCTNGRMEDMESAYNVLRGNKVKDGVRCIIIPATMGIMRECVERGYVTAFIDAGAVVSTPTCGPCLGGYMGILAAGEKCIATTNRNFVGRMGHPESEVYLASPKTAAASAITGYITEYTEK